MKKKLILLMAALYLFKVGAKCQTARQISLGNSKTGYDGIYALNGNPAEVAWIDHTAICANYDKHFFMSPLDQKFIGVSRSKNNRATAFSIYHVGDKRLQQNRFSIQYAQVFSNKFALGLRINSDHLSFSGNYGSSVFFHADFGLSVTLKENLTLGFIILNLGRSIVVREFNERLPSQIICGLVYHFSEITSGHIELEKKSHRQLNAKIAISYQLHPVLYLRCGFQSLQRLFSAGLGLAIKKIEIDTSIKYNQQLGYSSSLGLIMNIGKIEDS